MDLIDVYIIDADEAFGLTRRLFRRFWDSPLTTPPPPLPLAAFPFYDTICHRWHYLPQNIRDFGAKPRIHMYAHCVDFFDYLLFS